MILVGKATRLAQFLDKDVKEYEATVRFGFETDTGDRTGTPKESVITDDKLQFTEKEIEEVLEDFRGEIWQTPPMYSAKKVEGKKLYELARKGIEIERKPVKINIYKLEVTEIIRNPKSEIRNPCLLTQSGRRNPQSKCTSTATHTTAFDTAPCRLKNWLIWL